jgi:hypothetical protein
MVAIALFAFIASTARADQPCCQACTEPQEKYYSIDKTHGFCGECCMKPSSYSIFKIFEPGLTKATDNHPCADAKYTNYTSTVTHGFGPVKMTLDLYAPTEPVAKQQTEEKLIINGNLAANACTTYRKVTGDACADSCLGTTVGVCPVSLVVKGGDLTKGTCEDVGYTHANGTVSQKAGPCGTLVFKEYTKAAGNYLRSASRSSNHREADTTISTFNYTKCPSSYELWATNTADPTKVPRTFNLSKFAPTAPAGFQYYELAFHDWTQKPLCPGIKCVGS